MNCQFTWCIFQILFENKFQLKHIYQKVLVCCYNQWSWYAPCLGLIPFAKLMEATISSCRPFRTQLRNSSASSWRPCYNIINNTSVTLLFKKKFIATCNIIITFWGKGDNNGEKTKNNNNGNSVRQQTNLLNTLWCGNHFADTINSQSNICRSKLPLASSVLYIRALYRITIYRLYRYFAYTIYIVSFILVSYPILQKIYFCLNVGYFGD